MEPPPSCGPQKSRKSMPPKTVAKPYQFEALVIIFYIFAIRRFSGILGGGHSAKRPMFVYVCEGFSYLCVFVMIDCVFVFGLMYLCMLNSSYSCAFVKGVHICVCLWVCMYARMHTNANSLHGYVNARQVQSYTHRHIDTYCIIRRTINIDTS